MNLMLNTMQEMLELNWNFDFFVDVSGTDYMLKKPESMKEYLRHKVGMNFVYVDPKDNLGKSMPSKLTIFQFAIFSALPRPRAPFWYDPLDCSLRTLASALLTP